MTSLFERAFLQAVKRRQTRHPTRLKLTIRSFHQVYLSRSPQTPPSNWSVSPHENEHSMDTGRPTSEQTVVSGDMAKLLMRKGFGVLPKWPERSPIRDPANREGSIHVAAQVRDILVDLREKRKLRIEDRNKRRGVGGPPRNSLMKPMDNYEVSTDRVVVPTEEFEQLQQTLATDGRKRMEKKVKYLPPKEENPILTSPFLHSRKRGDECSGGKAITAHRPPTKIERFQKSVLEDEITPLPRLRGLYESARAIAFRPTIRQQPQPSHPPTEKITRPQTKLEVLGKQVDKHGDRVPLRKVTYYIMGKYRGELPQPEKLKLPRWAQEVLEERGYTTKDLLSWIKVMRSPNATQAFEIMEHAEVKWPKFLIQSMLYSSAPRSQGEVVKIFSVMQEVWDSIDQEGKIRALTRMAELSAKKLPQGLPRVAELLAATDIEGSKAAMLVYNNVLAVTADARKTKQHQNYTPVNQLRNLIDESMITLLGGMADKGVHVKVATLRKVSSAKLAEDSEAAIAILRLAKPRKYIDLLEDMKGQEEDLALAYEVAKAESQMSSLEREFLKGHLLGRVTSKEMGKRLKTIQNWRVSTQETFTEWLDFLERRREVGPAPKEAWVSILRMCHDEWTFPTPFWEEAFELMEQDKVLPNTTLLCLVLKGIKEMDVLDRILETATTTHQQRLNDQIWQIYLQKLSINHAPRALEIFLNAHTTDSAAGTMDTLNIIYWNTLLNGLSIESRRTGDVIWATRAFDLLAEMERLSIFPSQQTLSALCKIGNGAGDKIQINGVPAWKAAVDKWHEWVVRPEDFGYKFNLPGIARLIPSQMSWRKFIRLAGNYGEYNEVFDATWAMLRFGVQPDWETLLDVDVFMQLSGDEERALAVREMFREWLGRYPTPREVIWHYRRWLRAEVRTVIGRENMARLEEPDVSDAKQIEAPQSLGDVLPDVEVRTETVVEQWDRREREKPWFERD